MQLLGVCVQGAAERGQRELALPALEGRTAHGNPAGETGGKTLLVSPIAHCTPCTSDTRLKFPPLLNPNGVELLQNLLIYNVRSQLLNHPVQSTLARRMIE